MTHDSTPSDFNLNGLPPIVGPKSAKRQFVGPDHSHSSRSIVQRERITLSLLDIIDEFGPDIARRFVTLDKVNRVALAALRETAREDSRMRDIEDYVNTGYMNR